MKIEKKVKDYAKIEVKLLIVGLDKLIDHRIYKQ